MSKRLGGKGITIPDRKTLDRVHVYRLASMGEAVDRYNAARRLPPMRRKRCLEQETLREMLHTPEHTMERLLAQAEDLIDEAILIDPRLTKRAAWRLAEDGIDACPAMVAAGEERCYLDRRKLKLADQATLEPVRIVISTDSKDLKPENAVAFIAAAKLAQQFRPLELWWQGAWLKDSTCKQSEEAGYGHVFHVPLIQGDMDFSRLVFVLSSEFRDHVSFMVMFSHAYPAGYGWGGGVGEYSYLEGDTLEFIRETGIKPCAQTVARYAAKWAGMEHIWTEHISDSSAEQRWTAPTTAKPWNPSADDRARWDREERERQAAVALKARERQESV